MIDDRHDTVFEEDESAETKNAQPTEVSFELLETQGRWLLKVVSGPNTGAEFPLLAGSSYLMGTDSASCDIVFQDLSVSRQHARVAVDAENRVSIEDLGSRNGTFVDGEKIGDKKSIASNALITMGTTTFMLIDREGEHATIVSPLMTPSLKKEEPKAEVSMGPIQQAAMAPIQTELERMKEEEKKQARHAQAVSALIVLGAVTGLFVLIGIGTTMLFKTQKVVQQKVEHPETSIEEALKEFPSLRFSYNPVSNKLLLVGHLLSPVDKIKLLYKLQQLPFISSVDSSNVVIDSLVWQEMNMVLSTNPAWKSVTMYSPSPGKFVLTGFLKTRQEGQALDDYMSQNFRYPDLLENKVVVEEDLRLDILSKLVDAGFRNVKVDLNNGELTLSGSIANGTMAAFTKLLGTIKNINGVRALKSYVTEVAPEQAYINISDKYNVSGYSSLGKNLSVVINGRIVTVGDSIDGMTITDIRSHEILLKKDDFKYRIDYNM